MSARKCNAMRLLVLAAALVFCGMLQVQKASATCGLSGSLWYDLPYSYYYELPCQPYNFGAVISNSIRPPYFLVNSAGAVPYCQSLFMNFFQFPVVTPPSDTTNFTLVVSVMDTQIPAGVAGYWGTDGVNYPNQIFALIDPDNGTNPRDYNTYTFYFSTGVPVSNLAVAFIGFNNPGFIDFGPVSLIPTYNPNLNIASPPLYLTPFPAIINYGVTNNQTVQLFFTVYTGRPVYFEVVVLRDSRPQFTVDSSLNPVSTSGSADITIPGLRNFVTYEFAVTVVDLASRLRSTPVYSDEFIPAIPGTTPPCGLEESLWSASGSGCRPGSFGAVINVQNPLPSYGLVNSPVAVDYCRALYMNFFQFPIVHPPNDTANFTFIIDVKDTTIPAGVGAYWGTDGVSYPNFIAALVDPINGTIPTAYNTYTFYFTTGVPVDRLAIAFVGFNNPNFVTFGAISLVPNYDTTRDFSAPAPYLPPFPIVISYGLAYDSRIQLFFNAFTTTAVYFHVQIFLAGDFSHQVGHVETAAHPVSSTGPSTFNITGLTNWVSYQFVITTVDILSELRSQNVTSYTFVPSIPGTTPPCGLKNSLWYTKSYLCQPYGFGAIISLANDPKPYGLVNSPAAVDFAVASYMNFYKFPTVTPPSDTVNFTLVVSVYDTAHPAGVAGYWSSDGVTFPNFIFALIDPDNGTIPNGYNTYTFYFTTRVPVMNLTVAFVGFNNPSFLDFHETSLIPTYNPSLVIDAPAPYLTPLPVIFNYGVEDDGSVQLFFNAFTARPVFFSVAAQLSGSSEVVRAADSRLSPVSSTGETSVTVTGLTNWLTYQFVITAVDASNVLLRSTNITTWTFQPHVPGEDPPCGMLGSLWNYPAYSCTPWTFYAVIDAVTYPVPYGLVNSPVAAAFCQAIGMNTFIFTTVTPPQDTTNFTLVMNVYDTTHPAAVGGYWGTDGENFPNFIFALIHPENGTNRYGYNTYNFYFSTGVPVATLSILLVGFNNPTSIQFHESSLFPNYNPNFAVSMPAPYTDPFGVTFGDSLELDRAIRLYLNVFTTREVYLIVAVQEYGSSQVNSTVSSAHVSVSGVTTVNITELTNWKTYQFVVTTVDVQTGLKSHNVTSGQYRPHVPGTTPPCGLPNSLWNYPSYLCSPPGFYHVIDAVTYPAPYGLVNSGAALAFARSINMDFYQMPTVHPPSDTTNFTLVLNIYDTTHPAAVAGYWGTDGVNFPNFIFALIHPDNGTNPFGVNTYNFYFSTRVPVANLSIGLVGFNNPSAISFEEASLLPTYNPNLDVSLPEPYTTPFPVTILSGSGFDRTIQLFMTVYTARPTYFSVAVQLSGSSQVLFTVNSTSYPVSTTGRTYVNITGLTNWQLYQFVVTPVDVATGARGSNRTSGTYQPHAPGAPVPCGVLGSLWNYPSASCSPPSFGSIIDSSYQPSYGLINSPLAVTFARAIGMNFYQFATVHPPSDTANFTFVMNMQDTQHPAAVAGYWGTDGVNYPNYIFALVHPDNSSTPTLYNTYNFYFTTGVPVANLSVAFVGFNNPSYVQFHETSLFATYNSSIDFRTHAPYPSPFPVRLSSAAAYDQTIQLFFYVYTVNAVYFTVAVQQSGSSEFLPTQESSDYPVHTSGLTSFNVTGLTNWHSYYFIVTTVEVIGGAQSNSVKIGPYTPSIPGTLPPCGLPTSLWYSAQCTPPNFGAVINADATVRPYGLVNSPVAVAFSRTLSYDLFQFATVHPPANAANFTLSLSLEDTQHPAGVAGYWGTDGVNYPNFIFALLDPDNGSIPNAYNNYTFYFSTGVRVPNLSVAFIGFNNPSWIYFGPVSLVPNYDTSRDFSVGAPYLIPFPAIINTATSANQGAVLGVTVYTARPVYLLVTILRGGVAQFSQDSSLTPVSTTGATSFTVTGLNNSVSYTFKVTVVDRATGLMSRNVTSGSVTPTPPPTTSTTTTTSTRSTSTTTTTRSTTTTTSTTPTTSTTSGVPSSWSATVSCQFDLSSAIYHSAADVANWTNNQAISWFASTAGVPERSWITMKLLSLVNNAPSSVHARTQTVASRKLSVSMTTLAAGDWLLTVDIIIRPVSSSATQDDVNVFANRLLTALNSASSQLGQQLASQSVYVVHAEISRPSDSSDSFFGTAWHAGVVAAVVIVGVLLLLGTAAFLWKRYRNGKGSSSASSGGANGVASGQAAKAAGGKYAQQLETDADGHGAEGEGDMHTVQMAVMGSAGAHGDSADAEPEAEAEVAAETGGLTVGMSSSSGETDDAAENSLNHTGAVHLHD